MQLNKRQSLHFNKDQVVQDLVEVQLFELWVAVFIRFNIFVRYFGLVQMDTYSLRCFVMASTLVPVYLNELTELQLSSLVKVAVPFFGLAIVVRSLAILPTLDKLSLVD